MVNALAPDTPLVVKNFTELSNPERQARSLEMLRHVFTDDGKELEGLLKQTSEDKEREDLISDHYNSLLHALFLCEPTQVLALVKELNIEITAESGIDNPEEYFKQALADMRSINTPANLKERIFRVKGA